MSARRLSIRWRAFAIVAMVVAYVVTCLGAFEEVA